MAVLGALLVIVATLLGYLVHLAHKVNQHWKNRGVPHKTPMLFFGNSINAVLGKGSLMQENRRDVLRMFPKAPLVGYYDFVKPVLIVNDLDLVQRVLIKDFSHFNSRPMNPDEEKFPELVNLSNMAGKRWKSLRNKMIPVFTTGKLRLMFDQMSALSDALLDSINTKNENVVKSVDLKKRFNCYSMDIIGSTAFGIDVGSLKDNDNEFARFGRTAFGWGFTLRFMFMYNFTSLAKKLGVGLNSPSTVKYFSGFIKQALAHRVSSGGQRNDFVNLMLMLKEKGVLESGKEDVDNYLDMVDESLPDNERVEITENLILSNAFLFIMAGFDTVGTLLALFCYDLSQNIDIQDRLRSEVQKSFEAKKGVFNYETIRDTPYMEMCVKETMRLHTLVGIINRECNKEYTFPGTNVTVKDRLMKMRDVDDKLVYALNCSIPSPSFRGEIDPAANCKELYDMLQQNHSSREKSIRNCIEISSRRVQELRKARDTDPSALKAFNKELTKLRLLKSELNVEEVVQDRSKKLYYERCRDFFKPPKMNVN